MNDENLKKGVATQFRAGEEQAKIASRGGKASVEARRRRRTLREELLLMLEDEEVQKSLTAALLNEAIKGNNAGSVRAAFETIRDTIGEKPAERVETRQTVVDMSKFTTEEIKAMLNDEI